MRRENIMKAVIVLLAVVLVALVVIALVLPGLTQKPEPTEPTQTQPVQTTAAPTQPVQTTAPATESTTAPTEYIGLTMTAPAQNRVETLDETLLLAGMSDPAEPLTVNGVEVARNEDGSFSYEAPLSPGSNEITVSHKGETAVYQAERRYCVQFYSPSQPTQYLNNATVYINIAVRQGSQLQVTLNGEEITMKESKDQLGSGAAEGFLLYTGKYVLPQYNQEVVELGPITYTVTCDGITETYSSGDISGAPRVETKFQDASVTPSDDKYINVGSGYIVEIVDGLVETFNGRTTDDKSNPTYNYLPAGTVDYGYQTTITSPSGEQYYRLLRCGIRVYESTKNTPYTAMSRVVDCYTGYLPDHNEISIASLAVEDRHTYLTLDCLWKAPFYFDFEEQEYTNPAKRNYTVEQFDASYVDITFCYATQVAGSLEIPADHPLFSGAEWIANESDYTLRLYLKKAGGLYGWDSYYNEDDQLVFRFLNPAVVTAADNAYGADLTGVVVMLDVGHGGGDTGAAGKDSGNWIHIEKDVNLDLALAIQEELESIGATVLLNRTDDSTTTQRERVQYLRREAPNFCLCIHQNSNVSPERFGYETGYFTIFTHDAAHHVHDTTMDTGIYDGGYVMWFYYYVCRQTTCPVVLTENGYMSNPKELETMIDADTVHAKAEAFTQGIANYFLDLNSLWQAPAE